MGAETALAFLAALQRGRPVPEAIVICGPQAFVREYVLDAVRTRLRADGAAYRSIQVGAGGDFGPVLGELRDSELFAPRKLVACRVLHSRRERGSPERRSQSAEPRPSGGSDESALAAAIARGFAPNHLALLFESDNAPAKLKRAVEAKGAVITCARPFDDQLPRYAEIFAAEAGLKLSAEALEFLVARRGGDLPMLANALSKARIASERGRTVAASDLDESGAWRAPEIFELGEAITQGDPARALMLLDRAVANGRDPVEITSLEVIPVLRRMLLAAAMVRRGQRAHEVASSLGMKPQSPLVARSIEGAKRLGPDRLRTAHGRASQLDAEFKMGLLRERREALSSLLLELMPPA